MDDINVSNQPVSSLGASVSVPQTPTTEWPTKKKSNKWKIIGAVLAVFLVVGTAGGAFYFTQKLNKAATLNNPASKPYARDVDTTPTKAPIKAVDKTGNKVDSTLKKDEERTTTYKTETKPSTYAGMKDEQAVTADGHVVLEDTKTGYDKVVAQKNDPYTGAATGLNDTKDAPAGYYAGKDSKGNTVYFAVQVPTEKKSKDQQAGCTVSSWTPAVTTICAGTAFTQTSNCKTTRQATGTKDCSCTATSWTPDPSLTCTTEKVTQTSNCGTTREVDGTKDCSCTVSTWTPATNTVCSDETLTQTSNCGTEREVDGTKECGEPDLSMEKKAYKDETSNSAGSYKLTNEIDTVSKNQIFVYAFEVVNSGTGKAENVVVSDTLKGDNQELLTLIDAESRCKYTTSTRKITCSGMNVEPDGSDTYKFRVKVSDSATNGETIKNVGVLSYTNMPTDGEIDASLELAISTVVGCNNSCTSDDECVSGLSCDTDTGKCRRPACVEASNCNCPVERVVTEAPTRRATVYVQRVQPTVLPETGILDFPGVAAFGGGLLLAIVGILLAL